MLKVHNLLSRSMEPFEPLDGKTVKMYVCGPTVYDNAHIGHALSAIVFDTARRYLQYRGYHVLHVMNFTDVDDKIINRAQDRGMEPLDLAQQYIDAWFDHVRELNLLPAHHYPRASQVMPQIWEMIGGLIDKGLAYPLDGDVYFDVDQLEGYGKLSGRQLERAKSGTRVEVDARKADAADFALWKGAKLGEIAWESPWGPGRPGWHIECSAMILHYLGEQIDIHGGGNDLIFPHHENEIAQSEGFTEKRPFARYWLHNGMLQLRGEKMSKSLGNLISINEFLENNDADVLRIAILNGHYRKPLAFGREIIENAEQALRRLHGGLRPATGDAETGAAADTLGEQMTATEDGFIAAMDNDFNTAGALGQLFNLVRAINTARDANVGGAALKQAQTMLRELAGVLGLSLSTADDQQEIDAAPFIDTLIDIRAQLRQAKQWGMADTIRDKLTELGIVLEDGSQGTGWRKK
ncbi:MAG: cysteine--tRNA ligase [Chloroflexota bacterium]